MSRPDLSVVVACYEEEESLPPLFCELDRLGDLAAARGIRWETVFVNDGSSDATGRLLAARAHRREGERVVAHPGNRGFGAAMRTGFDAARGRVIVSYDADATYPIEDVLRLRDVLLETGADVAGATPFGAGGEVRAAPHRILLSRGAAGLYRAALRPRGPGPTVLTCAFRAYRREAIGRIAWRADGFPAAAEVLVRLLLSGARVAEVPSTLSARRHGRSKMNVVRTGLAHLLFVLRVALRAHDLPRPPARPRPRPSRRVAAPADLAAWNAKLNASHPMRGIEHHPNPVVRAIEERRRRQVVRLAAPPRGGLVLDVGAEEGAYAERLAQAGARPVALDIDLGALARGRERHGATSVVGNAEALPLCDGSVSRVVLAEVLEHCPDPERALLEALRVVAPTGRVALSVPDDGPILSLKRWIRRLGCGGLIRGLPPGLAPGHLHVFDREGLRELLVASGCLVSFTRDLPALAWFAVVLPCPERV